MGQATEIQNSAASAAASLKRRARRAVHYARGQNSAASAAASLKPPMSDGSGGASLENSAASAAASLKPVWSWRGVRRTP